MRVLKFGGTSVGSANSIQSVKEIVLDSQKKHGRVIVVLSAMSGVTNLLLEAGEKASKADESYAETLNQIKDKHFQAIQTIIEPQNQEKTIKKIEGFLAELSQILQGVYLLKEFSARTKDLVASFGERMSCTFCTEFFKQHVPDAEFADARAFIKTDSNFINAKVDYKETDPRTKEYFDNHKSLQIVTGFIGSNAKGETTTLGRGGSDYTAAIIGGALNAEEIEIWTDVDGMLTADPRVVKKAFMLPAVSYIEAMELSHFGAKVIYPPTLLPAISKKIPISIKNTFNPKSKGTLITDRTSQVSNFTIKGITSIADIALMNLQGSGMMGETGFSGRLFNALAKKSVNIILITQASSEYSITFAITPSDVEKALAAIDEEFSNELAEGKLEAVKVEKNVSVLAIVGENMRQTPGIAAKMFQSLGSNGINVIAIAQGSSEYNLSVVIPKADMSKALNALHQSFFDSDAKTLNLFIVGVGLIGSTLINQIKKQRAYLLEKNSINLQIVAVTNSKKMLFNADGINLETWKEDAEQTGDAADLGLFVESMIKMNLPNSIFVDNTSNKDIVKFYPSILGESISVVTPNKIANSGTLEMYKTLHKTAREHNVQFLYETNVGAGLPIIGTLKDLLNSGDQILKIEAVLSGTLSFIFNSFKKGTSFAGIVKDAKAKGYTEPDPRDDLNGMDVARKILILARDSGFAIEPDDVTVENILPLPCQQAKSVEDFFVELEKANDYFEKRRADAEAKGCVLRFIASLENGKATVSLKEVDANHAFYSMSGSDNIISFTTERYKDRPLVVKGPGAGAEVTAAGVFADIIKVGSTLS